MRLGVFSPRQPARARFVDRLDPYFPNVAKPLSGTLLRGDAFAPPAR